MTIGCTSEREWAATAHAWQRFGATDLLVDTGVTRLGSVVSPNTAAGQLKALSPIKEALGPVMAE
jgi:hypothetical protein